MVAEDEIPSVTVQRFTDRGRDLQPLCQIEHAIVVVDPPLGQGVHDSRDAAAVLGSAPQPKQSREVQHGAEDERVEGH